MTPGVTALPLPAGRGPPASPAALPRASRVGMIRIFGRDPEFVRGQLDATLLELAHERRPDAGGLEEPLDLAVRDAGLLEREDILHQDLVVLDAEDLRD